MVNKLIQNLIAYNLVVIGYPSKQGFMFMHGDKKPWIHKFY